MKQRIIAIALILPLLVGSVGCANQGEFSGQLKILSQSMTVHEFSGAGPQSAAVVSGRAQNISQVAMNYATIAVNFYDKNKNLIATASAVKQNLQPGETWDFSVQTVGPDAWKAISYDIAASMK
jgi:flagellar basal body-associated protein FliL